MKSINKIFLIIFLIIIASQLVLSIGISPAKQNIDFRPNEKVSFTYNIVNNENKDFTAIVYVRGELEKNIKVKNPVITFTSADGRKTAEFELDSPAQIGKPGSHSTEIVVIEYPAQAKGTEDAALIQARGSVVAKLNVLVPFPGKYAEADMHIQSAEPKQNVIFNIPIFNYGQENILKAKAVIRILGATYEKITEFETESISIETKGQAKLTASWLANVNPGTYHAVAEVYYDNEKILIEKNFNVGSMLVEIEKITTGQFTLGGIARFDITLANKWSEAIPNVYGDVTVSDKKGTIYANFKTASVDIKPLEREIITGFWDTAGVQVGTYDMRIAIHYADKVTEKLIEAEVNIDSIRTIFGPTGQVVSGKGGFGKDAMLVVLVLFLIIINIGWFVYFKKKKK